MTSCFLCVVIKISTSRISSDLSHSATRVRRKNGRRRAKLMLQYYLSCTTVLVQAYQSILFLKGWLPQIIYRTLPNIPWEQCDLNVFVRLIGLEFNIDEHPPGPWFVVAHQLLTKHYFPIYTIIPYTYWWIVILMILFYNTSRVLL